MAFIDWFFSTPTPLIATISAIVAFAAHFYQKKEIRKRKACELAMMCSSNFLPRLRFANFVMTKIKYTELIRKFEYRERLEYDTEELLNKARFDNISQFDDIFSKITYSIIVDSAVNSRFDIFNIGAYNNLPPNADWSILFQGFLADLANDLEAMAMYFNYNVADEKLVYQSLHRALLNNIHLLYYTICKNNRNNDDRVYDNLISLIGKWRKRKIILRARARKNPFLTRAARLR